MVVRQCTVFLFFLFCILWFQTLSATPAARHRLPDGVKASIRFLPRQVPDSNGNFEIEIYLKARFLIESIEVVITHSEEIVFSEDLPSFQGKLEAGKEKRWKIKGVIKENPRNNGKNIPASIVLGVRYLYPYREGVNYIVQNSDRGRSENKDNEYARALRRFDGYKGKNVKLIKPLQVWKPNQ